MVSTQVISLGSINQAPECLFERLLVVPDFPRERGHRQSAICWTRWLAAYMADRAAGEPRHHGLGIRRGNRSARLHGGSARQQRASRCRGGARIRERCGKLAGVEREVQIHERIWAGAVGVCGVAAL